MDVLIKSIVNLFAQNGRIICDEKPFREPQFPRLPVSCLLLTINYTSYPVHQVILYVKCPNTITKSLINNYNVSNVTGKYSHSVL